MKKLKGFGIGMIVIFILMVGYSFLPQTVTGVFDQINPMISQKNVYVQVDEQQPKKVHHRYEYSLTGYTSGGNEKKVTFTSSTLLPEGSYLKVDAKGSYVKTWEMVKSHKLPSKVKEKFKE